MSDLEADVWGENPMGVDTTMVRRSAEILLDDYVHRAEYSGAAVTWEDFAPLALRVLNVGLTDTSWEDR